MAARLSRGTLGGFSTKGTSQRLFHWRFRDNPWIRDKTRNHRDTFLQQVLEQAGSTYDDAWLAEISPWCSNLRSWRVAVAFCLPVGRVMPERKPTWGGWLAVPSPSRGKPAPTLVQWRHVYPMNSRYAGFSVSSQY